MSTPTGPVRANCLVASPGRQATSINLDSARGSVILSDNNPDALQGHPFNASFGIASMDQSGSTITINTNPYHLPIQNAKVTAVVTVNANGPHGSFGFEVKDESGTVVKTFPLSQATGPHNGAVSIPAAP